jgi:hypothetical protein
MKRIIVLFVALWLCQAAMADMVYLKDGQVLRGNILSQTDSIVVIETEGGNTETLDRKYVDRVSQDTSYRSYRKKMRNVAPDSFPDDEWIFKFSVDFDGSHQTYNSNLFIEGEGDTSLDGTQNVNSGVAFGLEFVSYDTRNLGFGGGLAIQGSRNLAGATGNFSFIPLYALVKLRTEPDRRNRYKFITGQLGYNFFGGDLDYRGDNGDLNGGLYFGVSAGIALNRIQFELLYSENRGRVRGSGSFFDTAAGVFKDYVESGDIRYSKLGINIGFLF